jgi:hypothetical protein
MKKPILIILICTLAFPYKSIKAQHESEHKHHSNFHKASGLMGFSFMRNSIEGVSNHVLVVPVIGLNYDYFFKGKWGVGLHSELILQQFKVEKHKQETVIERENPISLIGQVQFKPHHRWTLFTGYGIEIEKHKNLQLIRIGGEYGIELPKNWEVGLSLEFDYKPDAYSSLFFGISFSKLFHSKKPQKE